MSRRAPALVLALALSVPAAADVFLVRHAEGKSRTDERSTLSDAGRTAASTAAARSDAAPKRRP